MVGKIAPKLATLRETLREKTGKAVVAAAVPLTLLPTALHEVDNGLNGAIAATIPTPAAAFEHPVSRGGISLGMDETGQMVARLGRAQPPPLTKFSTEHIGQITGTAENPLGPLGMSGTDLGVSFQRDGKMGFLLGDSRAPGAMQDRDSVAMLAEVPRPHTPMQWSWQRSQSGGFLPLSVPGVRLQMMEVPVEAVPIGDRTYVFFTTGWDEKTGTYSSSVLAHANRLDFSTFTRDHVVPSNKFINVSVVPAGEHLYIYGSGPYRKSAVFLARVEPSRIADRSAWQYYAGAENGVPMYRAGEEAAVPIAAQRTVGELSVRYSPELGGFLMAYNSGIPRGIQLRYSRFPDGPWSDELNIFEPTVDRGYGHFMHADRRAVGADDGLAEPGRENEWAGEYGPYIVGTRRLANGAVALRYTMSSWNPYQIQDMESVIGLPGARYTPPPSRGAGLPRPELANGSFERLDLRGWAHSGARFKVYRDENGVNRLTTFDSGRGRDATRGTISQSFRVDDSVNTLEFNVRGGDATVELWDGPNRIREVRGPRSNDTELPVRWQLGSLRGKELKVVVRDDSSVPWGFVDVSGFVFR